MRAAQRSFPAIRRCPNTEHQLLQISLDHYIRNGYSGCRDEYKTKRTSYARRFPYFNGALKRGATRVRHHEGG